MAKLSTKAAGIDTGKHKLDVALSCGGEILQIANNEAGYGELCEWLRRHRVKRIGIEASGGYERDVVEWLRNRGQIVIIFQPIQVRAYARFHLKWAKNDRIDARLIAACAADREEIREPSDPRLAALKERLRLIEQIEEDAARMKTRLEAYRDKALICQLRAEIKRLVAWRRSALKALFAEIARHADLQRKIELLSSIDGVGPRTALAMLVHMPELGMLTREEAGSLAGLAPFDDDSAQRRGQRHIFGGRHRLRPIALCSGVAGSLSLEQRVDGALQAAHPSRQATQACSRCLCQKAHHLCQYRAGARNALGDEQAGRLT